MDTNEQHRTHQAPRGRRLIFFAALVPLLMVGVAAAYLALQDAGGRKGQPPAGPVTVSESRHTHSNESESLLGADLEWALEGQLYQASDNGDVTGIQTVYGMARSLGLSDLTQKAVAAALYVAPDLEWANLEVGNRRLQEVFDRIPEDDILDTYGNEAYETLCEEREFAESNWGTPEKLEELSALLEDVLAHLKWLKNNRLYLDEYPTRDRFMGARALLRTEARSPYIMFVELEVEEGREKSAAQKKRAADTARIVDRNLTLLHALYTQFMSDYKTAFNLPEISELEEALMRNLKLWTFSSHASSMQYLKDIATPLPPDVGAYYNPNNQWITLFDPPDSIVHGGTGQLDVNTDKVAHEGFHQLMHTFTKVLIERETAEDVHWEDPRTRCQLLWFQEGMAELYGSARAAGGGKWELRVLNFTRLGEWIQTMKVNLPDWSFEELRSIQSDVDLQQLARSKGFRYPGRLSSLFNAQAWSWCYFLYNHENGKYRDKLIEYMGKELKGVSGPEEFARTWGAGENYDWAPIEKEWRSFVQRLWADQGLK